MSMVMAGCSQTTHHEFLSGIVPESSTLQLEGNQRLEELFRRFPEVAAMLDSPTSFNGLQDRTHFERPQDKDKFLSETTLVVAKSSEFVKQLGDVARNCRFDLTELATLAFDFRIVRDGRMPPLLPDLQIRRFSRLFKLLQVRCIYFALSNKDSDWINSFQLLVNLYLHSSPKFIFAYPALSNIPPIWNAIPHLAGNAECSKMIAAVVVSVLDEVSMDIDWRECWIAHLKLSQDRMRNPEQIFALVSAMATNRPSLQIFVKQAEQNIAACLSKAEESRRSNRQYGIPELYAAAIEFDNFSWPDPFVLQAGTKTPSQGRNPFSISGHYVLGSLKRPSAVNLGRRIYESAKRISIANDERTQELNVP